MYLPRGVFVELHGEDIDSAHHGWKDCHQLKLISPHGRRINCMIMILWRRGRITRDAQRRVQEEGDPVDAVDVLDLLKPASNLVQLKEGIPVFQSRI